MTSPVIVRPRALFFGFVKANSTKTATVTITGPDPFEITSVTSGVPECVVVGLSRAEAGSYSVEARLRAPEEPGIICTSVRLALTLAGQRDLVVPVYAEVEPARQGTE